jgi:hypothetical protein
VDPRRFRRGSLSAGGARRRSRQQLRRCADGSTGIFYGPRCIARYGPDGKPLSINTQAARHASTMAVLIGGHAPRSKPERSGQITCYDHRPT